MFFKKKEIVKEKPKKEETLNTRAIIEDVDPIGAFNQSVQKTPFEFMANEVRVGDKMMAISQDGALSDSTVKGIQQAYEPNVAGKEVIYTYYANQSFIGFQNCALLSQNWLINKCCMQPPVDAAAIAYDITLKDDETTDKDNEILEKIKDLSNFTPDYHIIDTCREFGEKKRRFGQILCMPLIDGVDYSFPFNIDAVGKNSYKGMVVIEPQWFAPVLDQEATTNPVSRRFYKPTYFRMPDGRMVHYSWVFFGTYGNIPDILKPTYYFGGYPLPQLLYEQVYAAEKTAKEVPMLAQSKRLNYVEGNLNAYITDEERLNKEIKVMSWLRNNWGWLLVKKDQKLGQLDTSLADFDNVVMLSYQIVAAIAGMPSARLLETSPKGWQSTGSYEDENYKKLLLSIQTGDYVPILNRHYQLLTKSMFGKSYDYNCVFKPIDTPTEKERAEINEINSRTNAAYVNAGVVSAEEVRDVLREDENSGFNVLTEEMQGEPADEEAPFDLGGSETPQSPFSADEWKEEKHPRKDNGQFGKGGSSKGDDFVVETKSNKLASESVTGDELRKKAVKYYEKHLAGKTFKHPDLGDVKFSNGGYKKPVSFSGDERKLRLFPFLPSIIQKGKVISEDKDRHQRENVMGFYTLKTTVSIDGKKETVRLSIRKDNMGKLYYDHVITKKPSEKHQPETNHGGSKGYDSYITEKTEFVNLFFEGEI